MAIMQRLLKDESGSTLVELSLFIGFLFLTGAGFLFFSASQFKAAFMEGGKPPL